MVSPARFRFAHGLLLLVVLLGGARCVNQEFIERKKLGEACESDDDCGGMACRQSICTRSCTKQGDCPAGFDCGLLPPADADSGGFGGACVKSTVTGDPGPTKGGFGTDCSLVSAAIGGGSPCDANAKNP